jgi:UDP-glucose 4-epimerase
VKILLTGSSGFIGGHLLQAALRRWGEANVTVLSSRPAKIGRGLVYRHDFSLDDAGQAATADTELLIHAGAFTPKNGSAANDITACNGNIAFADKLLSLPLPALRKVVFLSTLDVYAPSAAPLSEESTVQPVSLYGWSKLYGEQMIQHSAMQRGVTAQILRIGHVYGPGEEQYSKFLPNALRNIVSGKPVELWGEGRELRSLIYIDDVVQAILSAADLPSSPGVINVVGDRALSVRALLERAIELSGRDIPLVHRAFEGQRRDFVFDTRKLKQHLLPEETDLDNGLRAELAHMERIMAA